jgi:hypothetical protein
MQRADLNVRLGSMVGAAASLARTVPLLALLASGCNKLEGARDEPAAETKPSTDASALAGGPTGAPAEADPDPANTDPPADPSGHAEPAPAEQAPAEPAPSEPAPSEPPPTPQSEFDGLLVRLSELADPRAAVEPSVEQDNKAAWAHYKAKEYEAAAKMFARVAARDPAWKHAHNIACASAKAGAPDDVRIALAESFRRGGERAKASANKDSDLASVRKLEWFSALMHDRDAGGPVAHEVNEDEDDDDDDDDVPIPPNCPPGITLDDHHYCLIDVVAPFTFAEVIFDQPITLDLEVPARPAQERWRYARGKIPWKELRAELGIQHTIESDELWRAPEIMGLYAEGPLEEDKPFFWWPEDNTAVLVLPHRQKIGRLRIRGVILARKTAAGWRATNLPMVLPMHEGHGGSSVLEAGLGFRYDGFELFTLAQVGDVDKRSLDNPVLPTYRWLCRIRWEQGKLARACTETWRDLAREAWGGY